MQIKISLKLMMLLSCLGYSGLLAAHGRGGGFGVHHGGFHGHSGFGVYLGAPLWGYPYYAYPPPPVVTVPVAPPVYIQQAPPASPQYPSGYWYYCHNPQGYYPYVSECPTGWQPVSPTPNR